MKFYKCLNCGKVVTFLNGDHTLECCGKTLKELVPGIEEAAIEKHIPVCHKVNDTTEVIVGEVAHPMTEEHYIEFIAQVAKNEVIIIKLNPGDEPKAIFPYRENAEIYAYCNLHGLWQNK